MNDNESQLKIQALVDGELSVTEAQEVQQWLERDAAAQSLAAELRASREYLRGNEAQRSVPEARDFYWSKIAREIERAERETTIAKPVGGLSMWLHWLVPTGGVAALALLFLVNQNSVSQSRSLLSLGHEIETTTDETSSITFRSESAGMTVVWVDTGRY